MLFISQQILVNISHLLTDSGRYSATTADKHDENKVNKVSVLSVKARLSRFHYIPHDFSTCLLVQISHFDMQLLLNLLT